MRLLYFLFLLAGCKKQLPTVAPVEPASPQPVASVVHAEPPAPLAWRGPPLLAVRLDGNRVAILLEGDLLNPDFPKSSREVTTDAPATLYSSKGVLAAGVEMPISALAAAYRPTITSSYVLGGFSRESQTCSAHFERVVDLARIAPDDPVAGGFYESETEIERANWIFRFGDHGFVAIVMLESDKDPVCKELSWAVPSGTPVPSVHALTPASAKLSAQVKTALEKTPEYSFETPLEFSFYDYERFDVWKISNSRAWANLVHKDRKAWHRVYALVDISTPLPKLLVQGPGSFSEDLMGVTGTDDNPVLWFPGTRINTEGDKIDIISFPMFESAHYPL